uniref:CSON009602 protein n=1 Tax=Culicoides sonorensis TaxID=179676 RepID=A0A336M0M5_CULSO
MNENIEKACRMCLEENCKTDFFNLLLDDGNNRSNKALTEIFRINIEDNIQFPHKICLECNNLLLNFYDFYLEVMKNQAKLLLEFNSNGCKSDQASPQPSNIVDDETPLLASQDSAISTSNQPTRSKRHKRKRRGSTHRDRELTPVSTDSETDELPLSLIAKRQNCNNQSTTKVEQKFTCQECSEEFTKIYLYETHKETVHSSYPIDASPNIDTIKIISHNGSENVLKFKCKLCTFQSESQWETRRHQSTVHSSNETSGQKSKDSRPCGQKLVKVLSLNAIAERIPLIKRSQNLTDDQRLKIFYGFSCSRCKPCIELPTLSAFERHSEQCHNLTDISWLCCEVKLRNNCLVHHLNYHLGLPLVKNCSDNVLYETSYSKILEAIKKGEISHKSEISLKKREFVKKKRTNL